MLSANGNVPKKLGSYNNTIERPWNSIMDGNVPKKLGSYNSARRASAIGVTFYGNVPKKLGSYNLF